MQISQRIGKAASPGDRADGNRKQLGFRALTAIIGRPSVWRNGKEVIELKLRKLSVRRMGELMEAKNFSSSTTDVSNHASHAKGDITHEEISDSGFSFGRPG